MAAAKSDSSSKDIWDKIAALTPLMLGLLVTGGAAVVGFVHDSRQDSLAELSALEKFQQKMTSDDLLDREFAYTVFAALGHEQLALRLIRLRNDREAESVVDAIKLNAIAQAEPGLRSEADATLKELQKPEEWALILGGYRKDEEAQARLQQVRDAGYAQADVFQNEHGLFQVAIKGFSTRRDAIAEFFTIRERKLTSSYKPETRDLIRHPLPKSNGS